MYDAYETTYGIHDHGRNSDDMALIRWRPAEDIEAFDPTTERMVMFYNASVLKYSGITFDRFMELPRHRQETIALACQEVMRLELEEQKRAAERLEEEKRKIAAGRG